MPPKQTSLFPDLIYTHAVNNANFQTNQGKLPIQFDKKSSKAFAEMYCQTLTQMNMACLPCLVQQVKPQKPLPNLSFFSTILDQPSCVVVQQCLSECVDVQSVTFTDCEMSPENVLMLFSFTNQNVQGITVDNCRFSAQVLFTAVAMNTNRLFLRFFRVEFSEEDISLLNKILGSEFDTSFAGIACAQRFDYKASAALRNVEILSQNEAPPPMEEINRTVSLDDEDGTLKFLQTYIIRRVVNGLDTKVNQNSVKLIQQLLATQLKQTRYDLLKLQKFQKFDDIYQRFEGKIQQLRQLLDATTVMQFLHGQTHTDTVIVQLLSGAAVRVTALESVSVPE